MSDNYMVVSIGEHNAGELRVTKNPLSGRYLLQFVGESFSNGASGTLSRSDIVELALRTNEECSRIREWIGDGALAITDEAWEYMSEYWDDLNGLLPPRAGFASAFIAYYDSPSECDIALVPVDDDGSMLTHFHQMPFGIIVRMREAWISEHGE